MKETIQRRIRSCLRQKRIDNALILVSTMATSLFFIFTFYSNFVMLTFFLLVGWLVNLALMFYCRQLWLLRINRWEAMRKWYGVLENVTLLDATPLFQSGSEGTAEEIRQ